ncbi:MAG: hypothetical protein AMXMBFR56_80080 [Polyangiaceae bacterium]
MVRRRVFGIGLVACALGAGGCGSDDTKSDASGGSSSTGGAAGAGGQGGAAGSAGTGGAPPSCDTPPAPTGDAMFDDVAKWYFAKMIEAKAPGGALVVYIDGKLHKATFGSKKATACDPVTQGTRFSLTRMAHPLTSLAAVRMALATNPLISLDDPITKWMPELIEHLVDGKSKARGAKLTLRHLLSNTSGYWPVYWSLGACPDIAPPQARGEGPDSLAAFFVPNQATVVHEPGQMWMHSEPAVTLAARVLEKAAGKTFAALMKERLSDPSGIGLSFDASEVEAGDYAHAIVNSCSAVVAPTWGAYADVNDIGKMVASLAAGGGDGVFSKEEVKSVLDAGASVVSPAKGGKASMGWQHLPYPPHGTIAQRGAKVENTNGWAAASHFVIVPEKQFGFAVVANSAPGDVQWDEVHEKVLNEYLPGFKAYDYGQVASTWGEYAGQYKGEDGALAQVQVEGAQLKLTVTGNAKAGEYLLVPAGFVWWGFTTEQGNSIDHDWFGRVDTLMTPSFRFYRDGTTGQPVGFGCFVSEYGKIPTLGPFLRVP